MTISAKIITDSITNGIRLATIQTKAPKFLDAEFEKHRMISSNSSSDRAIPLLKMLDSGYYLPKDIRLNQPGMSGDLLLDDDSKEEFWNDLKDLHGYTANILKKWDRVHKQHLNRYLMGFSWQNKIATATEWDNFFKLRLHDDAQPEIQELARGMLSALQASKPHELNLGEWHLPYVDIYDHMYTVNDEDCIDYPEAIKCSVARCARVSYNNHDNSTPDIEKDMKLADKLLAAGHMSCFEHQAVPMEPSNFRLHGQEGITHEDRYGNLWSNNFRGWIQYRALL